MTKFWVHIAHPYCQGCLSAEEQFCNRQRSASPNCTPSLSKPPRPPPESQVTSVTVPALCPWADCGEHEQGRATHSTPKTASRAARRLFNSSLCGRTQTDVVAVWKCSHLCSLHLWNKKKLKKKNRNSISALGRPGSVWVVFKKRNLFSE